VYITVSRREKNANTEKLVLENIHYQKSTDSSILSRSFRVVETEQNLNTQKVKNASICC